MQILQKLQIKFFLLLFSLTSLAQGQQFIPLEEETLEFVSQVNYTLYANQNPVYSNLTSKDTITRLPQNIIFDSIAFSKTNYKATGFSKAQLPEIVLLTKTAFELDEVVLSKSKPKEILIGESNRFVKRRAATLSAQLHYGILFAKKEINNKTITQLHFFVEKVQHKTTYKIQLYAAEEIGNFMTTQYLDIRELLFESPVLTLESDTKNKVAVDLEEYAIRIKDKNVFVCLKLEAYYDDCDSIIQPKIEEQTRLKFQRSDRTNYYCRTSDLHTKKLSDSLINLNAMINRDFALHFFKKPHKSTIVAPAILLFATAIP